MTATDELRRLLDERGVEHYDHENGEPLRDLSEAGPDPATSWRMGDASVCAVPNNKGTFDIWIDHATPEQAIAATLGSGECEMEYGGDVTEDTKRVLDVYFCSKCGSPIYNDSMPRFCIYCGAKVIA